MRRKTYHHPTTFTLTTTSVVIVFPVSVIVKEIKSHKYLDLGKSALPRNVFGWALTTAVSLAARGDDRLSTQSKEVTY